MTNDVSPLNEIYRTLFEHLPDACYFLDPEGRMVHVNAAAAELTGYTREEIPGMSFVAFLQEKDVNKVITLFHKALKGSKQTVEIGIIHKDGTKRDILVTGFPVMVKGKPAGVIGISRNMADRNVIAEELSASRNQLHNIVNSLDIVLWSFDETNGVLKYISPACVNIFGLTPDQLRSHPDYWRNAVHPEDREVITRHYRLLRSGQAARGEYRIFHTSGELRWIMDNAMPVHDESGALIRIDGITTDITERKQIEERLRHMASHDSLTGLPNRPMFMHKLEEVIVKAKAGGEKAAFLYLDLDRFKFINDSLGHDVGDQLLERIAARLKACVREQDVVSRHGGDEFAVCLNGVRSLEQVRKFANKILDAVKQPVQLFHLEFIVTTSIGISVFPDLGTDAATLLKQAEQAMYFAKDSGKNVYQFFSLDLDERLGRKMFLEQSLHHALKNGELYLQYQPIVDAETGGLQGFEALVRWTHPTLGPISPAEMIPIAEETGLIVPIGEWVLHTACAQMKRWQDKGHPAVGISVNISALQLSENFVSVVENALERSGLSPYSLTLEITESTAMLHVTNIIPIIEQLRALGVKISIDDFGTGYSSLSYLKKFQIHALKIDQSFVRDIDKDANQEAIIKAVIAIADSLRIGVVAEGVETEEQIRFLRGLGCRSVQGYFFSRPLPVEQIDKRYFPA